MSTLATVANYGEAIRTRRRHLHLTQEELSELAGVSTRFIHDLEHGKPTVRLDSVVAVTTALGLTFDLRVRTPHATDWPSP